MSIAAVGNNVWVGNFQACNEHASEFPLSIHIWYGPAGDMSGVCDCILFHRDVFDVTYSDNEPMRSASQQMESIVEYARQPGKLLVHCAAGICRAPTVAVLCKVARGCTPWQAMHDVAAGMWLAYRHAPSFGYRPLNEIFNLFSLDEGNLQNQ